MEAYLSLYNDVVIIVAPFLFGLVLGRLVSVTKYQKKFEGLRLQVESLRQRVEGLGADAEPYQKTFDELSAKVVHLRQRVGTTAKEAQHD